MENLRFYDEETSGCEKFAKQLSECGEIYVNDAFGAAHRKHASTTLIAEFFSNKKCSGLLLNKEINAIEKVLKTGKRPIVAILGGAKVSSKITIINNILEKVDAIILGGGMAYTFIKAQGGEIGDSICEDDKQDLAIELIQRAKEKNVALYLPTDVVAADDFNGLVDGLGGLEQAVAAAASLAGVEQWRTRRTSVPPSFESLFIEELSRSLTQSVLPKGAWFQALANSFTPVVKSVSSLRDPAHLYAQQAACIFNFTDFP